MSYKMFGLNEAFPRREYAISANAVLGIRDSGKSYTATKAAEELFDDSPSIPFVAFDPIGIWWALRVPGKGKGYPIVVAGGRHADIQLTPGNAKDIVRAAMKAGISLVLDLHSADMSKGMWRKIVGDCTEVLMHENPDYGLRHVFIEEAAEFVPQRVTDGYVFAAVEKLVRMGGNSKLGCTLINPRSADLNKSVLELCANVFLHRAKGKNTLTDLRKWFDLMDLSDKEVQTIGNDLPYMKSGECWALLNDVPRPIRFRVPEKNSKHPDRRDTAAVVAESERKRMSVDEFVSDLKAKLAPKPATGPTIEKAKSAGALLKTVAASADRRDEHYEHMIETARGQGIQIGRRQFEAEVLPAILDAQHAQSFAMGFRLAVGTFRSMSLPELPVGEAMPRRKQISAIQMSKVIAGPAMNILDAIASEPRKFNPHAPVPEMDRRPRQSKPTGNGGGSSPPGGTIGKSETRVLIAIAQHPDGVTREQLTILTGFKKSTRDTYIYRLKMAGAISDEGGVIGVTSLGMAHLPAGFEPLPTGSELRQYWLGKLPESEARILALICDSPTRQCSRDYITDMTGFKKSTRDTYIYRLGTRRLIETPRPGEVVAAALLFD